MVSRCQRIGRHGWSVVGEDAAVGRRLTDGIAALVLAGIGCGDNFDDPFVGLVRVSGESPFSGSCNGTQAGNNFSGMEVEPSVAADPTNPSHLVGAWQQDRWSNGGASGIRTAVSQDGGATWTVSTPRFGRCGGGDADNGGGYDRASDPWVTFAADGTPFVIGLVFDTSTARNAIVASRSIDGGMTWTDPTVLRADSDPDAFNDKESITADPVDPGRVYAIWDRVTGQSQPSLPIGTGPAWFARTTDGAWETAVPIYDPGRDAQTIGNVIAVLPDGTLIDVFDLITKASSDFPVYTLAVIRSIDKGQSWSDPIQIGPMSLLGVQDPENSEFVRTGASLPEVAVDRGNGAIYIAWQHRQSITTTGIAVVKSIDGGLTWSPPVFANGAADAAAFTPMIAVDGEGTVGVTYYDLRDDHGSSSSFRATAWLATSRDGGATWSDEALSDPFDLRPASLGEAYFIGDYQGLAVAGGAFLPFFVAPTRGSDNTNVFVRPLR
jgi:hypothetical protein